MLRIYDRKMFYLKLLKYENMSKFIPKGVAVQLHICFAQFKLRLLFCGSHNLTFIFSNDSLFSRFLSVDVLMYPILQTIWTQIYRQYGPNVFHEKNLV